MAEPIGSIPVEITGDYSSLQKDLQQAEAIARQSGRKIGEALGSGFDSASSATREYSSDAEALIATQKKLDVELANAAGTLAEIRNAYEVGAVNANVLARAENELAQASTAANVALERVAESNKMAAQAAAEHAAAVQKTITSIKQAGQEMQSMGAALTASVTLPLVGMASAALVVAGNLEQTNVAFKTLLGSTVAAQMHLEELKKFAMTTPFEFPDLVTASKRLQALGFSVKEVIPTLTAVGNAAAGLGTGAQGIERITLALGQMQAKGKVSAEEMRQLAEAGIPAWQILADAIGKSEGKVVSVAETMKRAEKGFIDGNMAVTALIAGMQEKFGGLMEAQSKTLLGVWSNFKDQVTFILGDLGDALAPVAKQMLTQLSGLATHVQEIITEFKKLPAGVQEAAIAFAAVAAAAGPVLYIFGQLTTAVGSIMGLWTELGLSIPIVTAALSPFVAALATVAGTITAIHLTGLDDEFMHFASTLKDNFSGIAGLFSDVTDGIKSFASELAKLTGLSDFANAIADGFKNIQLSWKGFAEAVFPEFAMLRDGMKALTPIVEKLGGSYETMANVAKLQLANLDAAHADANRTIAEGAGAYKELADAAKKHTADASAAAEAYAKKIKAAFSELGLKDTALEVKKLQDAYDLLAKSGKLSADQLIDAQGQLQFKIRQLRQDVPEYIEANRKAGEEINKVLEKTAEDAHKTELAFGKAWDAWVKGAQAASSKQTFIKFDIVEQLGGAETAIGRLAKSTLDIRAAYKGLNVDVHDAVAQQVKWFEVLVAGSERIQPSLRQFEEAWQHVQGALAHLATYDLPKALEGYDAAIAKAIQLGEAEGQILQKEMARNQAIIANKELRGADATAELIALEQERQMNQILIDQAVNMGQVYISLRKDFNDAFEDLEKGIGQAIISGQNLGDVFVNVAKKAAGAILDTLIKGALTPLQDELNKTGGLFDTLAQKIGGVAAKATGLKGLPGFGGKESPVNVPEGPPGGDVDLSKTAPASGDTGSGAGGLGSIGGAVTAISSAVSAISAISAVISNFQFHAMNKSLDVIVKHTLEIKNEVSNLRADEWEREGHLMLKLDDMWNEIRNVVEVLRLMGQIGGGGSSDSLSQQIADAINSNPHQTGNSNDVAIVDQGLSAIADSLNAGTQAANDYTNALQTTASTAYSLDEAVSSTTSSLYALNEATKQVNGALPGFVDGMDRAIFNSMTTSPGQPGQNLTPNGPHSNITPYIMPVPVPDALTGPGGVMQGAMMGHSNSQISYPTIAPVVGGPGVTRGGQQALVTVYAVDPSGRQVANATIQGLEERGIRVR